MDARSYLEEIQLLDEMISNKSSEIYQLRCLATSCTAPTDREPSGKGGASDRVGNIVAKIVAKIVDLQNKYNEAVDRFVDAIKERVKVIEEIRKPLYYTILHKHYIGVKLEDDKPDTPTWYMSLADIAEVEGYSYSHVCDYHRKALDEVQRVLDGR